MAGNGRSGRERDHETIDYRMRVWANQAPQGTPVADIAARLRISKAALNQMVLRERRANNPLAVYHASYVEPGSGQQPDRARDRLRLITARRSAEPGT